MNRQKLIYISRKSVESSPDFEEFLSFLGERVPLQGWSCYSGGLDTKSIFSLSFPLLLILSLSLFTFFCVISGSKYNRYPFRIQFAQRIGDYVSRFNNDSLQ